jgi:hypothetical protein
MSGLLKPPQLNAEVTVQYSYGLIIWRLLAYETSDACVGEPWILLDSIIPSCTDPNGDFSQQLK